MVPATSETINLSLPKIAFTKLLLPTFGLPIKENLILESSIFSYFGKSFTIKSNKSLIPRLCSALISTNSENPNS